MGFKFGDAVRLVEAAGSEPVLAFVQRVEGDVVDVVKFAGGVVAEIKGLVTKPTLAEAQVEGAGEHHSHCVAPAVDVEPEPEPEPAPPSSVLVASPVTTSPEVVSSVL